MDVYGDRDGLDSLLMWQSSKNERAYARVVLQN
jgi:hypothetical protein